MVPGPIEYILCYNMELSLGPVRCELVELCPQSLSPFVCLA